jgi:hypothetical protein
VVKDHSWTPVDKDQDTAAKYTAGYVNAIGQIKALMYGPGLSYAIFTQITDVENERNGFVTYDREVFKGEMGAIKAAHDDLIAASLRLGQPYTDGVRDDFKNAKAPGMALTKSHFNNLSAKAEVTAPASGEAGLVFRVMPDLKATAKYQGYFAGISPASGVILSYVDNGIWTPVKSAPLGVVPGRTYLLKVDAFGGTIRVYVDDMSTPVFEATDYRSLVGAVGVRATTADARFVGFEAANPFVRLEPLQVDGFVIHNSRDKDIVHVDTNVNRDDDCVWQIVPGLADATKISFESARLPGSYLRDNDGKITFEKDDGSSAFKDAVTWSRKPGLKKAEAFSYESHSHPGEYLQEAHHPLSRQSIKGDGANATFLEVR